MIPMEIKRDWERFFCARKVRSIFSFIIVYATKQDIGWNDNNRDCDIAVGRYS